MNKPVVIGVAAVAAVAAASFFLLRNDVTESSVDHAPASQSSAANSPSQSANEVPLDTGVRSPQVPVPVAAITNAEEDDRSEDPAKMFKADAAGNLKLSERARLNVEKVLWLYSPEEQQQKLAVMEQTLPPSAYRQLTDLLDRYKNFTLAAKQTYPPDAAPKTVEDAITQHEGLSALRKAHFGAEAAEAMFGREEKINRQLLEFMNLEKHEGLTMEEKAMKAQEMLSKSPDLAAIYDQNRAEPERTK